ncbi:MAG: hypothetical protein QFX35_00445 [Candidatus Verstraetearchaeota archaeon]|nr:hypothetical protein [Candidatus Verstraetearchaeota archaeon]
MAVYRRILDAWIAERGSENLQQLPEGFNDEVNSYLEGLGGREGGIAGRLAKEELKRAKQAIIELKLLRREKICKGFLTGTLDLMGLLEDERGLFKEGYVEKKPQDGTKRILVRLLRDVPSFVGVDLKTYGPYKTEDVALLPAQNVEALVKRGIAKEIRR